MLNLKIMILMTTTIALAKAWVINRRKLWFRDINKQKMCTFNNSEDDNDDSDQGHDYDEDDFNGKVLHRWL